MDLLIPSKIYWSKGIRRTYCDPVFARAHTHLSFPGCPPRGLQPGDVRPAAGHLRASAGPGRAPVPPILPRAHYPVFLWLPGILAPPTVPRRLRGTLRAVGASPGRARRTGSASFEARRRRVRRASVPPFPRFGERRLQSVGDYISHKVLRPPPSRFPLSRLSLINGL